MDPVALSTAVSDVFQSSYTLSYHFLNNQSPKSPPQIYSKLYTERKRTEAWANEVRSINVKKLRETFSPEEYDRILNKIGELRQNYEIASRKLERVDHKEKPPPNVDLLNKDYNDLEILLSKLTAANDALPQTAHPPPMDSPRSREKSSRIQRQRAAKGKAADMSQIQEPVRPSSVPPMWTIYLTTHKTLVIISVRRSDPKITRSASRLKLWGVGLFEMAIPLDTVFDSNRDAFRPVRQCILRILVDILVWAEQELKKLGSDGHNTERFDDSKSAQHITALLGTDELIPMALESWKDSVDQHEYLQAGRAFNTNYNPVPGLVEILFDLLPALRAARQTYCSRPVEAEILEDNGTNAPAALRSVGRTSGPDLARRRSPVIIQSTSSEQPIFDESYVESANLKFDQINDIFKEIDKMAKKRGRQPYTPRLQSEREALRLFHADRKSRKDVKSKDLEDVFEKQKQLVRDLGENGVLSRMTLYEELSLIDAFIADTSWASNPSVTLGLFRKRQGKYLEKHTRRVESFLLALANTNSSMRNTMHGRSHNLEGSKP